MGKLSSQQQQSSMPRVGWRKLKRRAAGKRKIALKEKKRLYRYTVCISGDKSRGLTNFPSNVFKLCFIFGPEIFFIPASICIVYFQNVAHTNSSLPPSPNPATIPPLSLLRCHHTHTHKREGRRRVGSMGGRKRQKGGIQNPIWA